MGESLVKINMPKALFVAIIIALLPFSTGCRRGSSGETPKYYKRELAAMKREEERKAAEKQDKERRFASDRYPWRGKRDDSLLNTLPCRINCADKCLSLQSRYLSEAVHGKHRCEPRLRD